MTEHLTPKTLDLEVPDSSLTRHVVSLDKELYSISPRCINGYQRHTTVVTLQWASIPSRGGGGVAILLGMLHAKETGISFGRLGVCLVCAFTPYP